MTNEVWNPLYAEYRKFFHRELWAVTDWTEEAAMREQSRKLYAYAVPSEQIGQEFQQRGITRIVEMGSGTGYWKKFLQQFGVRVMAFDESPYHNHYTAFRHALVHKRGAAWFAQNSARYGLNRAALLLVWPPYDDPMAYNCLRAYQGDTLIYVGEGSGGCTGDDAFHALLEAEWEQVWCNYECANWPGIHSHEMIYRRKS